MTQPDCHPCPGGSVDRRDPRYETLGSDPVHSHPQAERWLAFRTVSLFCILTWVLEAAGTTTPPTIPASERNALIAFYTSTNGADWTNKTGWLGAAGTECTWRGVQCAGDETTIHVVGLFHTSNNLAGRIPPSIASLPKLQSLNLALNRLTGSIPSLSGLQDLQGLFLNDNRLTGSIPSLSGSTRLERLYLYNNQLTGSIPPLSGLTRLRELFLYNNQLTGEIPSLAGMASLEDLRLGGNPLTGSIPPLSGARSLQLLSLASCQLSGSIPSLSDLTNLRQVNIPGNQLTGSIPSLSGLTRLEVFHVYDNRLTGPIPSLAGLTRLQNFNLQVNQLSGSVPSLSGLTDIEYFIAGNNRLTGSIPPLSGLPRLRYLWLNSNQLTGNIPSLNGLKSLEKLLLYGNQLTGTIPPVDGLAKLEQLYVQGNALHGSLPASLRSVSSIDLRHNALHTSDTNLASILNSIQVGGDWQSTQTVAPTNLTTSPVAGGSFTVSWTPITYKSDAGFYRVSYSTTPGGPYTPFPATTTNKNASAILVAGLDPNRLYYLIVTTTTRPHQSNQNTVVSDESAEVLSGGPVITRVTRQYPGVFLQGTPFTNRFDVAVDWRGAPGRVTFAVDGGLLKIETGTNGSPSAFHVFDLSRDFQPKFAPNVVTITPINSAGQQGLAIREDLYVFPYPAWLGLALNAGGDPDQPVLKFTAGDGVITGKLHFQFPTPAWGTEGVGLIPNDVPFFGGRFGFVQGFGSVDGTVDTRGAASVNVRGSFGFKVHTTLPASVTSSGYRPAISYTQPWSTQPLRSCGREVTPSRSTPRDS